MLSSGGNGYLGVIIQDQQSCMSREILLKEFIAATPVGQWEACGS